MINVNNLCFDYPGKRALDHLSFALQPNTITALVGPNGAGKTTLLRCLAALDSPTLGSITVEGIDVENFPRQIHERVSYLSDTIGLYDRLTVKQNLLFAAQSHLCPSSLIDNRVQETAEELDLVDYLDKLAGELSRGLRQRVAIGQTLIHHPKILILDEPASGLDPNARYHLSQLLIKLRDNGMTLIVSSHILSELEDYSTDMIILDEGKMVRQQSLSSAIRSENSGVILKIELTESADKFKNLISSLPSLYLKKIEGNNVIVDFKGTIQEQHQLLKALIEKNIPVYQVTPEKDSLQDLYLHITQTHAGKE